jgi:hypothetical protein
MTTIINYTNPIANQYFNLNKQTFSTQQWDAVDLTSGDVSFQQIPRSLYIGSTGDLEVVGLEGLFVDQTTIATNVGFTYLDAKYFFVDTTVGVGMKFEIDISGAGNTVEINVVDQGYGYTIGDTITIPGSVFGGTDTVDDITCDLDGKTAIFKNIADGVILPIQARIIITGGTNCDDIIALY